MQTILEYISDGSQTVYDVDFGLGYIDRAHVYVFSSLEVDDFQTQLTYTWVNATQIELTTPVTLGEPIKIRRVVPRDLLINDYVDGAIIHERNLDDSFKQALMILQEIKDGFYAPLDFTYLRDNLNMLNHRITGLANAVDGTDAVNYNQVLAMINLATGSGPGLAEQLLFDNTLTGATATNVQDAIDELILELTASISVVASSVTTETNARIAADNTLQANINAVRAEIIRKANTITGTVNALITTTTPTLTSYTGVALLIVPASSNTSATTINIDGVGIVAVETVTGALVSGDLVAGLPAVIRHNGTKFILMNPQSSNVVRKVVTAAQLYDDATKIYTFTHNLGVIPIVQLVARCTLSHNNYLTGEELIIASFRNTDQLGSGDAAHGQTQYLTTTQIQMHVYNLHAFHDGDGARGIGLDINKWELYCICMG